jgi:hypothetical protein
MTKINMTLECDSRAFASFEHLFKICLEVRNAFFDTDDLPNELVRIEQDDSSARTGKVFVRLYPSDAFLDFAAAVFARDVDRLTV